MSKTKTFKFKAKNSLGKEIKDTIKSESLKKAKEKLNQKYPYILSIKKTKNFNLNLSFNFNKKINFKELSVFARQLSTITQAGITISNALKLLENDNENIKKIRNSLKEGKTFSSSCQSVNIFPAFFINMIEVGEKSGNISEILNEVAIYYLNEHKKRKELISALSYPIIILIVSFVIFLFLLLFILPTFAQTYIDMDINLPFITSSLLFLSDFIFKYFILIITFFVISIISFIFLIKKEKVRLKIDYFLLKIPILKNFIIEKNLVKFSNNLKLLYKSGISIIDSLLIVNKTMTNKYLQKEINEVYKEIKEGKNLYKALKGRFLFPNIALQMLKVGETTGNLEIMLEKIEVFFEEESQEKFEKITTLIEPAFIIILGGIIGIIVLSLIQPIFNMMQII